MKNPIPTNLGSSSNALRKVKFELAAKPGTKVFLAGSFNDWSPTQNRMRFSKRSGKYSTTVVLTPGTHEYKFLVDGEWLVDPECVNWVSNEFDTLNSVIDVD